MSIESPEEILMRLIKQPEDEILEFKSRNNMSHEEMGKYFSGLSNAAALMGAPYAWMIFGVNDKTHDFENSIYCMDKSARNNLKTHIRDHTSDNTTYFAIHEVYVDGKRVVMFQIPAARGCVFYSGRAYGRVGENICELDESSIYRLVTKNRDWSSEIIKNATIKNLDSDAINVARKGYVLANPNVEGYDSWSDSDFLNKAHLTIQGRVTNAAMVLLGSEDSMDLLDFPPSIRWILKDSNNEILDSKIFHIPLIKSIDELCNSITNVTYEYFESNRLFPIRSSTYDIKLLREAICNCIAHQDYCKNEMINVIEFDKDRLIFQNAGNFIPGTVESVLKEDAPCKQYRNRFLAEAMRNVGLVEIVGGGIRRMFNCQRTRMFPMPIFDFSNDEVTVTIIGRVIDKGFAEVLLHNSTMSFDDVLILDAVQKCKEISVSDATHLRRKGWITGSKPNYVISYELLKDADAKTKVDNYRKNRNNLQYAHAVTEYLENTQYASKNEIDELLSPLLSSNLSEEQKENRLKNIRQSLVRNNIIKNIGSKKIPRYVLFKE